MYCDFYALRAKPFNLTPDPDFLYLSRGHKEALAHLSYGVESRSGFVMVTGEVGSGKTTLLRTLIRNLGRDVCVSQVTNTRVNYAELLELALDDFGVPPRGMGKTGLLAALNEFLVEQFAEGRSCVLVVDEAQNLSIPTLEGLRMLSNLETEKSKLLHVILAGQPGLRDLIGSRPLEQLRQRITVRYHLGPMSPGEVGEYVRHRIRKVAADPEKAPVFPDEVIPDIYRAAGGIPRLLNVLCEAALLHGYLAETRVIGPEIVGEVAAQVTRDQKGAPAPPRPPLTTGGGAIEDRLAEIEDRLRQVLGGEGPDAVRGGAESPRGGRRAQSDLARRLQELERREAAVEERGRRLSNEWKRRMAQLEELRCAVDCGQLALPPVKVHICDPDPRLRAAVAAYLGAAGIDAQAHDDFSGFAGGLHRETPGLSFPMAVLGAVADDAENALRISAVRERLPHVPTIFLGDIDLTGIRRRILAAGADCFLEKPDRRVLALGSLQEAEDTFHADILRTILHIRRQYEAVFGRLGGGERGERKAASGRGR
ncbi:MAG: AAA family ATPase [Deferrisomatales bacterium]